MTMKCMWSIITRLQSSSRKLVGPRFMASHHVPEEESYPLVMGIEEWSCVIQLGPRPLNARFVQNLPSHCWLLMPIPEMAPIQTESYPSHACIHVGASSFPFYWYSSRFKISFRSWLFRPRSQAVLVYFLPMPFLIQKKQIEAIVCSTSAKSKQKLLSAPHQQAAFVTAVARPCKHKSSVNDRFCTTWDHQ